MLENYKYHYVKPIKKIIMEKNEKKCIEIEIYNAGVLSLQAFACVVPQKRTGISLTGVSASIIHSPARDGIIAFQKTIRDKKMLPFGNSTAHHCSGKNYRYLISIPVLGASRLETEIAIISALARADKIKAESIVIPAINTGESGALSYEESAKITKKAIHKLSEFYVVANLKKILLALPNENAYDIYKKTFEEE